MVNTVLTSNDAVGQLSFMDFAGCSGSLCSPNSLVLMTNLRYSLWVSHVAVVLFESQTSTSLDLGQLPTLNALV